MSEIDRLADELGEILAKGDLKANQIRNFYGPIAKVRSQHDPVERERALRIHRSRVAYLVARAQGKAKDLWDVFGTLLRDAKGDQIDGVCALAEATVAYHKFHSSKRETSR